MKQTLSLFAALSILAALPITSMAAMKNTEAQALVQIMLAEGDSPVHIINLLAEDGRSLPNATELAVRAASNVDDRASLGRAGVCAAVDLTQAGLVSQAVLHLISEGETEDERYIASKLELAMEDYATTGCIERTDTRPSPGAVTTDKAGEPVKGGGTAPQFPERPPVSPS